MLKLDRIREQIEDKKQYSDLLKNIKLSKAYKRYLQFSLLDNNKPYKLKNIHFELIVKNNIYRWEIHFEEKNVTRYIKNKELNQRVNNSQFEFFNWWIKENPENKSLRYVNEIKIDNEDDLENFMDILEDSYNIFNDLLIQISKNDNEEKKESNIMKTKFKTWLKKINHSSSVQSNYPIFLEKYIPEILKKTTIKDIENIFEITQQEKIEDLLKLFKENEELKEINVEKSSFPQASLKKYLEFLKYLNKENKFLNNEEFKIKNIMLYGAPGVGKTHNYRNIISMIEEGMKTEKEIFDFIAKNEKVDLDNDTFKIIKNEKRVEFITFHQSYSYEDFIEGFRPSKDNGIQLEDGIFKNICEKAINNSNKSNATEKLVFSDALDILLNDSIENEEMVKINLKRNNSYFEIFDYDEKSIFYTRQGRDRNEKYHTLAISTLRTMYNEEENNSIVGGLKTYYNPLLKTLLKIGKESKVESVDKQNFYVVIDEINRGNISKIFGELITLVEEDKRDNYEVTLPYSKDLFKIPSNLYIIATMNSTDKSIATIDIALRRRFTFIKMKPNEELVKDQNAKKLMHELNEYIENSLGEDYKLGHSYFMGDDINLEFVKDYKIKPLLEEYFYADEDNYKKVIEILEKEED